MPKYNVALSKTTGTVTATATTVLAVTADNEAAARRLALEKLTDDSGEVVWAAVPATTLPVVNGEAASAHVTAVTAA